jgi:translation initiation factor IF-2
MDRPAQAGGAAEPSTSSSAPAERSVSTRSATPCASSVVTPSGLCGPKTAPPSGSRPRRPAGRPMPSEGRRAARPRRIPDPSCGSPAAGRAAAAPRPPPGGTPPADEAELARARRRGADVLTRGVRLAQDIMGTGAVPPLLAAGSAAAILCEHSSRACIVVLGSRGAGGSAGSLAALRFAFRGGRAAGGSAAGRPRPGRFPRSTGRRPPAAGGRRVPPRPAGEGHPEVTVLRRTTGAGPLSTLVPDAVRWPRPSAARWSG